MSLDAIRKVRVVPVATVDAAEHALPLVEALLAAGMNVLEFTFRTAAAAAAIRAVAQRFPEVTVGAGTLLRPEQVIEAREAGAAFGVSPGCNPRVVRQATELGMPMVPGVATPTEIEAAMELGCTLLKFFPADRLGGAGTLDALTGPYLATGVRFVVTGGVNAANMGSYLVLPIVAAVFGSWFVNRKLIESRNWAQVTEYARGALDIVKVVGRP